MSVWITILLLLILAEVWWFGIHCTTYLSDIRDALAKMASGPGSPEGNDAPTQKGGRN